MLFRSGIATFTNLTLAGTVGTSYKLNFTSTGLTGVSSSSITVTYGTASQLAITTAPVLSSSGSLMATQPVITIQDAQGNTVANSTATVTITKSGGTLGGTQASGGIAAVAGVATFTNLTFTGSLSTNYTFSFRSEEQRLNSSH